MIAVLFIAPMIRESDNGVGSGVLAASADRLAAPVTAGVEVLDYELVLDGVPRELMPDHANGAYRIKQVIDHDTTGRFRFTSYTADGQLLSSIAQDPTQGRRVMLIRLEGSGLPVRLHAAGDRVRCRCPRWSVSTCRRRSR